ncbi:MAG: hypothetical protein EP299_02415 [Acidobacteria bacterium]|nr:MAG: hypothetical protein EP299_02415 [Acidobacteriota bacterium]
MHKQIVGLAALLVSTLLAVAQAQVNVTLTPDSSGVRVFVAIDGRIIEITDPDGEEADFDDPAGTGWSEAMDPTTTTGLTADLMVGPDGNIYFSVPSANKLGRFPLTGGSPSPEFALCDGCEPAALGLDFHGDVLATDLDSGGLFRWDELAALCSDGINPASFCFGFGSSLPTGTLVPGTNAVGPFLAIQEWYTGKLLSIWGPETAGPKKDRKGPTLQTSADPDYEDHTFRAELDGDAADLAITEAEILYAAGKDIKFVDLVSGDASSCVTFSGQGNPKPKFLTGDVGGKVYVATESSKATVVWALDTTTCSSPTKLKEFPASTFGKDVGGVAATFSTLKGQVNGTGSEETYVLSPDGSHNYRLTATCPSSNVCNFAFKPECLKTALNAIEESDDPDNPSAANASRGLPFALPGHARPFEYVVTNLTSDEFHQRSTAIEGTNFRFACCDEPCTAAGCDDPPGNADTCEFAIAIYSLPISSEIVPDPRGDSKRGTACYEGQISTRNAGNFAAEFCGWNSPAVETPAAFDPDEFFCGANGVATVSHGDTFPTKFDVGPKGEPCASGNELPVDLNVLFSAGVFGSCDTGTFVPLPEVEAILGIVPSGEGVIDPNTGQVKFAKAGPKKQYQFNFDTGQVPLVTGSPPLPTLVIINATFLEDSIEEGDQNFFLRVGP